MKKKPLPSGPGVRASDAFVRAIAALEGGHVTVANGAWRLSFPDGRADEVVPHRPQSHEEVRRHLARVEKQAAVVLRNPPVLYAITGRGSGKEIVRLSAVLSLSIGPALARRYVCTVERGAAEARVEEGGAFPEIAGATTTALAALPKWADRELRILARALAETCREYELLPEVQEAIGAAGERRNTELAYVDHLYGVREGEHHRLWGLPAHGTSGSAAVEAEARRLRMIVLERYAPRVRVRPLSIGILGR